MAPGKEKPTLFLKIGDALFIAEGRLLELYLIGDTIDSDVAIFGERNVVLFPDLTEIFGNHLLEDFALVVLGSSNGLIEICFGADELSASHKSQFLLSVRAEAERISCTTGSLVKAGDERHNGSVRDCHIYVFLVGEAPDVAMGKSNSVVAVNQIDVECGVISHFVFPFHVVCSLTVLSIAQVKPDCKPFFSK